MCAPCTVSHTWASSHALFSPCRISPTTQSGCVILYSNVYRVTYWTVVLVVELRVLVITSSIVLTSTAKHCTYIHHHSRRLVIVIPMTHASETGAKIDSIFRRRFLVRVSCKSGTVFVWYRYQIPAPNRTPFYNLLFQARNWRRAHECYLPSNILVSRCPQICVCYTHPPKFPWPPNCG